MLTKNLDVTTFLNHIQDLMSQYPDKSLNMRVYLALLANADPATGLCTINLKTLENQTRCANKTIPKSLNTLAENNLITIVSKGSTRIPATYQVNFLAPAATSSSTPDPAKPAKTHKFDDPDFDFQW